MKRKTISPLLEIDDLQVHFDTLNGTVRAVEGVSLQLYPGQTLGLVGESGSGKSVTALSILRLLPDKKAHIVGGSICYHADRNTSPTDMVKLHPNSQEIRHIRGNQIGMIFQEPLTAFSPVYTVGKQIAEMLRLHMGLDAKQAKARSIELLADVGIPNPAQRFDEYPHQFSGGMRQRAMIAMALSCNPRILIADEPTTALDVTIQAQIIDLLKKLQEQYQMAILLITHDLGVIAEMADEVAVMYMGRIVETSDVRTVLRRPLHPYTVGLMRSIPKMGQGEPITPIPGSVPDPFSVPKGCAFSTRCIAPKRDACFDPVPLREVDIDHHVRCTLYDDYLRKQQEAESIQHETT